MENLETTIGKVTNLEATLEKVMHLDNSAEGEAELQTLNVEMGGSLQS